MSTLEYSEHHQEISQITTGCIDGRKLRINNLEIIFS